jgi:zinc/manganese transport system substrate-binding protein
MVAADEDRSVVATTEVLGSIVSQLVGDAAEVTVIMPSGANPHSFEPSARDVERILGADVVVSNGLELEEALLTVLESAASDGATWFQAADHIAVRDPGSEGDDDHDADGADDHDADHEHDADGADDHEHEDTDQEGDHEHDHGAADPHIWTDPLAMRDVVLALGPVLEEAGIAVGDRAGELADELVALDAAVSQILAAVDEQDRKLVTGHRSLGYFADRYGFALIGTVIPSLSTSGEPTARELAQLIEDIRANDVSAVFTEVGTPQAVAEAVASDSGVELVALSTSQLPDGGTYQDLIVDIATTVAGALSA